MRRTPSGGTAKSEEGANQRVLKRHAEEQPPSPEMDVESDSSSEDDEAEEEARIARLETEREMAMEEEGDEEAAESEQCPARTKTGEEGFGGAVADEMGAGEMDVEEQHEEEKLGLLKVVKAPRRTKGRKRVTKTVINAKGYMGTHDPVTPCAVRFGVSQCSVGLLVRRNSRGYLKVRGFAAGGPAERCGQIKVGHVLVQVCPNPNPSTLHPRA